MIPFVSLWIVLPRFLQLIKYHKVRKKQMQGEMIIETYQVESIPALI